MPEGPLSIITLPVLEKLKDVIPNGEVLFSLPGGEVLSAESLEQHSNKSSAIPIKITAKSLIVVQGKVPQQYDPAISIQPYRMQCQLALLNSRLFRNLRGWQFLISSRDNGIWADRCSFSVRELERACTDASENCVNVLLTCQCATVFGRLIVCRS